MTIPCYAILVTHRPSTRLVHTVGHGLSSCVQQGSPAAIFAQCWTLHSMLWSLLLPLWQALSTPATGQSLRPFPHLSQSIFVSDRLLWPVGRQPRTAVRSRTSEPLMGTSLTAMHSPLPTACASALAKPFCEGLCRSLPTQLIPPAALSCGILWNGPFQRLSSNVLPDLTLLAAHFRFRDIF